MLKNLKWKLARLMYGRYGVDQLYIASGILFIVLQLLQLFVKIPFLNIFLLIFLVWILYRAFSKNILARQAENQKFMKFVHSAKAKWKMSTRRFKDIRSHRYRKCPECNTTLRLPRKTGTHKTRCPRCKHLFEVKIRI